MARPKTKHDYAKCVECGVRLSVFAHGNSRYCTPKCRALYRAKKDLSRKVHYAGPIRDCLHCKQPYNYVRPNQRYCSDVCRAGVHRARQERSFARMVHAPNEPSYIVSRFNQDKALVDHAEKVKKRKPRRKSPY